MPNACSGYRRLSSKLRSITSTVRSRELRPVIPQRPTRDSSISTLWLLTTSSTRYGQQNCPENFENRAALVGAEIARIEGRVLEAEQLYEQAIRSAHEQRFRQQ